MGQGYSLTSLSAGAAGIDVPELSDLTYEKSLGNARFMKTVRARRDDGIAVAKVVVKPYASLELDPYVRKIRAERRLLSDVPNALGYHRIIETNTSGFLVRQYVHSSLYDRLSTRPFLEDIEKKWIAFQLLCAVRDCHARNVYHGDIKTENCLVTSWNWLFLSDFSSAFKPTYLPEDNPADFSFYFDSSARRTCYIAPERFLSAGQVSEGRDALNWAMDIFSVGCVMAELFLESPIFTLSQLLSYRRGEYSPTNSLNRIEDKDVRELIAHMIQLEPESRYSADEYLTFWKHRAFPEYFYSFLHQYLFVMTDPTMGRSAITAGEENLGESDDRIDRIYYDFDKISYFLGYEDQNPDDTIRPPRRLPGDVFPLHLDIPRYRHIVSTDLKASHDDGSLIFLDIVTSSVRSTARASSRIRGCELMLAFAERLSDDAKLDRIVPYTVVLLNDPSDNVKVAALRTMTQIFDLIDVISPVNTHIFPEYILPRLQPFLSKAASRSSPLVRATYATCIASLAQSALRFLQMTQALRADGSLPVVDPEAEDDGSSAQNYQAIYEVAKEDLVHSFEIQTKVLLTDADPSVRRAFLGSVSTLCVFFGSAKASDVILSHLNTYLNDRDWMLKCAFFKTIVGVATYVGGTSLEEFILPLMVQALTDPEEFVVERVIRSFSSMAQLGLFQRSKTWELVDIVARFTMHPNMWIREATAEFITAATIYLSPADIYCIIIPLIKPYLKVVPSEITEIRLLETLKKPMTRIVFDMAYSWASKTEKGLFWKAAQTSRTFTFGNKEDATPVISGRDLTSRTFKKVPKNDEDEQWLSRLRSANMVEEDEFKLLALREYIWRSTQRRQKEDKSETSLFSNVVGLSDLGVHVQTVFFEEDDQVYKAALTDGALTDGARDRASTSAKARPRAEDDLATALREQLRSNLSSANVSRRASDDATLVPGSSDGRPAPSKSSSLLRPNGSPSEASPGTLSPGELPYSLRSKGSAVDLTRRTSTAKAMAETSMTSANALGRLDAASSSRNSMALSPSLNATPLVTLPEEKRPKLNRVASAHSYAGSDPSVLKLLDNLYLNNYPGDAVEFGPMIQPLARRQPLKTRYGGPARMWRPEGNLVAMLSEHTAKVTKIAVSPDHLFFITGSRDGSVRVWDSARLESNLTHRSRAIYRLPSGARVTSLCFLENTHCFAVCGDDASVAVVKVGIADAQGGLRYGKLKVLREWAFPGSQSQTNRGSNASESDDQRAKENDVEYSLWCEHYKADAQSMLLMSTNRCHIVALDLRSMSIAFTLDLPPSHGPPTCFCLGRRRHWLLVGTMRGILSLWDLRFRLRVKSWGLGGGAPIHRLALLPVRSRKNKVCVAGGTGFGDVTVWDLEKFTCLECYRCALPGVNTDGKRGWEAWNVDADKAEGMLSRFATNIEPNPTSTDKGVRTLAVGAHVPEDGGDARHGFFITGGPDRKVRFWDMARHQASMTVSGFDVDDTPPVYEVSGVTQDTTLILEKPEEAQAKSGKGSPSKSAGSAKKDKKEKEKPARSTIISLQQQQLLKSHLDMVTDVALLEHPYGMVISADRSGIVYVFQ